MPQNGNSPEPPMMTWGRAIPVIIVAALFDLIRIFFEFFWFFGPALVGVYCANKVGGVWVIGKLLASACVAGATAVGAGGFAVTAAFGSVMAMATGFAGWLAIGGYLMKNNSRIFKENALWFVGSLVVSEIPFVGSIPAISIVTWKMYRTQIKIEKAAHEKWEQENAEARLRERNQQIARLMQLRGAQTAQAAQEEENAISVAEDEQMQEANDQALQERLVVGEVPGVATEAANDVRGGSNVIPLRPRDTQNTAVIGTNIHQEFKKAA